MDTVQLQSVADRILDSHLHGIREISYTVENLIALFAATGPEQRVLLMHYLWERLVSALFSTQGIYQPELRQRPCSTRFLAWGYAQEVRSRLCPVTLDPLYLRAPGPLYA